MESTWMPALVCVCWSAFLIAWWGECPCAAADWTWMVHLRYCKQFAALTRHPWLLACNCKPGNVGKLQGCTERPLWVHALIRRMCLRTCVLGVRLVHLWIPFTPKHQGTACWLKMQDFLHEWTMASKSWVHDSNKRPRKCTGACLSASNMWRQLRRTLEGQGRWELNCTVCLSWEAADKLPAWSQLSL